MTKEEGETTTSIRHTNAEPQRRRLMEVVKQPNASGGGGPVEERSHDKQEDGWPFIIEKEVDWGDLDAHRHVNNIAFFRLGDAEKGHGIVIADQSMRYLKPLRYPDTILLKINVSSIGITSLVLDFEVCLFLLFVWFCGCGYRITSRALHLLCLCLCLCLSSPSPAHLNPFKESKKSGVVAKGTARAVYFDHKQGHKTAIPHNMRLHIHHMQGGQPSLPSDRASL
ncbi:hypothetical protein QOT17_024016 [Balamuthia mandrillaris]